MSAAMFCSLQVTGSVLKSGSAQVWDQNPNPNLKLFVLGSKLESALWVELESVFGLGLE